VPALSLEAYPRTNVVAGGRGAGAAAAAVPAALQMCW
jgi:hypothetical protein